MIVRGFVFWVTLFGAGIAFGGTSAGRPGARVPSLFGGGNSASSARQPSAQNSTSEQSGIHPAVVRVVAPGRGSISYGSGTLVDVQGDHGLVITNYHVINEATGNVSVHFPDGFYSLAKIRKVDRDWDLAALVIKRPNVQPVRMAAAAPRPGDPLTIAGYGSGNYRAIAGPCTQYVAPSTRMPFEMVELAASARQGDSGGPILDTRGELAGVLFGEGGGRTAGSYCGRVQWFLASLTDRPNAPASPPPPRTSPMAEPLVVAQHEPSTPPIIRLPRRNVADEPDYIERPANAFAAATIETRAPNLAAKVPETGFVRSPTRPSLQPAGEQLVWAEIAGESLAEQVKTFLAILGSCAVLMFAMKLMGGGS